MSTQFNPANIGRNLTFNRIVDSNELQSLRKRIGDARPNLPVISEQQTSAEFGKRFGDERRALALQQDKAFEDMGIRQDREQEMMKSQMSQRGLGLSPFAEGLGAPVREQQEYEKGAMRAQRRFGLDEHRIARIEQLKAELAQKAQQKIERAYRQDLNQAMRQYQQLKRTTGKKLVDELRNTQRQYQQQRQEAWKNIQLSLEKGTIGRNIGKTVGLVGGIALAPVTGGASIGIGSALGAGFGGLAGRGAGQRAASQYVY